MSELRADAMPSEPRIIVLGDYCINNRAHVRRQHVMALKWGKSWAVELFVEEVKAVLPEECVVVVVPSHDCRNRRTGLHELAGLVCEGSRRVDGSGCLVRVETIPKLAFGGRRDVGLHLESMRVEQVELVRGKFVVVLDDVVTTGTSMRACHMLLVGAGAGRILCVGLAKAMRAIETTVGYGPMEARPRRCRNKHLNSDSASEAAMQDHLYVEADTTEFQAGD